ncbi:M23 family metallopeptidase [Mastigocoleus testarum]|uniref:M23 family metallopeptidase n=1 Tax=Mastigocoleus testarum TaxID=996925 RepID=UPI0004115028|nr:M23 family metallopeptidase [Mastigocoleus testarum]
MTNKPTQAMSAESHTSNYLKHLFTSCHKKINKQPNNNKKFEFLTGAAIGIFAALPVAFASSVQAAQVEIIPSSPKLGQSISVEITPDNSANGGNLKVVSNGETYPVFPIAPNKYRAFIPTTPLQKPGRRVVRVYGDGPTRNLAVWIGDRRFPTQRIWLPKKKAGTRATKMELQRVKEFKSLTTPDKFWDGAFIRPSKARISTIYGVRRYYNGKFAHNYYHRGVDYAGAQGSPVVAPAGGRVALVGKEAAGFLVHGNVVGIDHGQGLTSIFMHLNGIKVKEGDMVKPGQLIGTIGSTGASTGPHLHWGLYVNGQAIDPVTWRNNAIK